MTHGERWIAAALKRLAGYAKARGFQVSAPSLHHLPACFQRQPYLEVSVRDHAGSAVDVAVAYCLRPMMVVDQHAVPVDELSAASFDGLTASLERRAKPHPRQLDLFAA